MAENTEIGMKRQQDGIVSENPYPAVFEPFADLLRKRFEGKICTNEDCIRYCFFSVLLNTLRISPNEIILEYPLPDSKGERKKVDFYVPATADRDGMVVEFKYDRNTTDHGKATTRQAGQIIADINRLARFKKGKTEIKRYFVYISDGYMRDYLKKSNKLKWLVELEIKDIQLSNEYLNDLPDTFRFAASETKKKKGNAPGKIFEDKVVIPVIRVYEADLSNNHVRVFEIIPSQLGTE